MRRIAVINQKGGVGKTTTVANLGTAVASAGRRVLLIDLDPQAHLSLHLGIELGDEQPSAYDVLTSSTPISDVALHIRDNVTLVPADIDLAAAEAELVSIMGREMILREAVDAVELSHDVLLIDCPPSLGVLTINALAAAEEVLIPLQAHFFALQGVSKLLDTVMLVRQRINPRLKVAGFVLCMHDATTRLAGEVIADLTRFLEGVRGQSIPWADACIYTSRIRRNIKLAESSSFGQTVFDYAPRSHGAADYADLAREIFDSVGLGSPSLTPPTLAGSLSQGARTSQPRSMIGTCRPVVSSRDVAWPSEPARDPVEPAHDEVSPPPAPAPPAPPAEPAPATAPSETEQQAAIPNSQSTADDYYESDADASPYVCRPQAAPGPEGTDAAP